MTSFAGAEIGVSRRDHAREADHVGADRGDFDAGFEFAVAAADAGGEQEKVHAAQFADQLGQPGRSLFLRHVQPLGCDLLGGKSAESFERLFVASGGAYPPSG